MDEGLILKLNQYGISKNLLRLIKCFLKNRKQRVALNVQTSSWTNVLAGAPQGSILDPLFFLIYIVMIYQMNYPPILNLQMIPLSFHLYATKTIQQKNLIMTFRKLVTGPNNGK